MALNGKQKGNNFEIAFCKKLSLFLSKNENDDMFWRSSNSGGRQTVRKRKGIDTINQDGDITVCTGGIAETFLKQFSIECKHYKDTNLWSIIKEQDGINIYGWWKKHNILCSNIGKLPILIVRQNNMPILWINDPIMTNLLKETFDILPIIQSNYKDIPNMSIYLETDIFKLDSDKFCAMLLSRESSCMKK